MTVAFSFLVKLRGLTKMRRFPLESPLINKKKRTVFGSRWDVRISHTNPLEIGFVKSFKSKITT